MSILSPSLSAPLLPPPCSGSSFLVSGHDCGGAERRGKKVSLLISKSHSLGGGQKIVELSMLLSLVNVRVLQIVTRIPIEEMGWGEQGTGPR